MATNTSSNILATSPDVGTEKRALASPEARARRVASLQTIREGTPLDVQQVFADLEATGDIIRATEWDDEVAEVSLDGAMEGDLSDEDDPFQEGLDDDPSFRPPAATKPAADEDFEEDIDQQGSFELIVRDGRCRFERPRWMRYRATNPLAQDWLDDADRRFRLLERIGEWLNEHRPDFLKTPDPWWLGCDALAELKQGHASVSPHSFLELSGIRTFASDSIFSRNTNQTVLAWEKGTLPLDFLFGDEARMAWVANAVAQLATEKGRRLDENELKRLQDLTKPKHKKSKQFIMTASSSALMFDEVISKANLIAATKWADVLKTYWSRILQTAP
jgi:hypothetical protein